jgi:hypothetical protein
MNYKGKSISQKEYLNEQRKNYKRIQEQNKVYKRKQRQKQKEKEKMTEKEQSTLRKRISRKKMPKYLHGM